MTAAARASAADPADDWPYRLVSTAMISLRQPGGAVTAALEARRLAPHFWRSHVCLAQAAAAAGQHELAAEAAGRALQLAPGEADVHVTAGKAALSRGDLAEARARQRAALAIEPGNSSAINELGRISLRSNDAAAAAAHFLQAARAAPGAAVFGRNADLALRRLAFRLTVTAALALAAAAGLALLAAAGYGLVALGLALGELGLIARATAPVRQLPPAARGRLLRLLWSRPASAAGKIAGTLRLR
jgi:tetratricopeptide (TPR) repeat protein